MLKDIASLIKIVGTTTNAAGDLVETKEKREVFVEIRSVGMKEVYEAHAYGLKPDIVFVLADYLDYDDEEFIEYNGKTYKVIRNFNKREDIQLEIVAQHTLNEVEDNANTEECNED